MGLVFDRLSRGNDGAIAVPGNLRLDGPYIEVKFYCDTRNCKLGPPSRLVRIRAWRLALGLIPKRKRLLADFADFEKGWPVGLGFESGWNDAFTFRGCPTGRF